MDNLKRVCSYCGDIMESGEVGVTYLGHYGIACKSCDEKRKDTWKLVVAILVSLGIVALIIALQWA